MNEIVPMFNESLIIEPSDLLSDYMELGIDSVLADGVLKDIPLLKTMIVGGKIILNIRERNTMKNLIIFLNELNSGDIDKEKLKKRKKELNQDSKKAEKELGRVLIILDQTIDNSKASILGKLYKAYINQDIDWNLFVELSEITNRLYVNDLEVLKLIYDNQLSDTSNKKDMYRIERLNALGIIELAPKSVYFAANNLRQDNYVSLNDLGYIYTKIIFS